MLTENESQKPNKNFQLDKLPTLSSFLKIKSKAYHRP